MKGFADFFLLDTVRADAAGVILSLSKDPARSSDNKGKEICEGLVLYISQPYRPLYSFVLKVIKATGVANLGRPRRNTIPPKASD